MTYARSVRGRLRVASSVTVASGIVRTRSAGNRGSPGSDRRKRPSGSRYCGGATRTTLAPAASAPPPPRGRTTARARPPPRPVAAAPAVARPPAAHTRATPRSVSNRYPTTSSVVTMAARRPIRDAFRATSLAHFAHSSPKAIPAVMSPHRAHGWLDAPGHSPGEVGGRSTAPQILGADVVLHDHRFERAPQPARFLELADVVEHHRGREHLRGGVRDALPRDVRRRAVDGLEDRRLLAHVRARREPQPSHQPRGLVREDVA